jgi:hypothetical protein
MSLNTRQAACSRTRSAINTDTVNEPVGLSCGIWQRYSTASVEGFIVTLFAALSSSANDADARPGPRPYCAPRGVCQKMSIRYYQ